MCHKGKKKTRFPINLNAQCVISVGFFTVTEQKKKKAYWLSNGDGPFFFC